MQMTPFQTDQWEKLEPKVKTLWRINGAISSFFIGLMVGLPEFFIGRNLGERYLLPEGVLGVLLFLTVMIIGQVFVAQSYENFRFKLGDEDLAVAKGIFWKQWKFISRNRVQHVDITAGPVNRYLGIVQVSIYVGGMAMAAAVIPGLTTARGEELRKRLVRDEPAKEPQPEVEPAPPQMVDDRPVWTPPGMEEAPTSPPVAPPTEPVQEIPAPQDPPTQQPPSDEEPPRG